ncbi:MAG: cupin domain-containing protein [Elusimicrobiota bacterium]
MKAKRRLVLGTLENTPSQAIGTLLVQSLLDKSERRPFSVHRVRMKPGASHPPLFHARMSELFLVLDGSMRAKIDGRPRRFVKGGFAYLPPGAIHEFHAGRNGVEVLAVFSPPMNLNKPDIVFQSSRKP